MGSTEDTGVQHAATRVPLAKDSRRKRKSRGRGLRVRTGCHACRARHLKCDETRPVCRACRRAARECDYPVVPASIPAPDHASNNAAADPDDISLASADHEQQVHDSFSVGDEHIGIAVEVDGHRLHDVAATETSPASTWSGWANVSAEMASLSWFGLVARDVAGEDFTVPDLDRQLWSSPVVPNCGTEDGSVAREANGIANSDAAQGKRTPLESLRYISQDDFTLARREIELFQHFVSNLSGWFDLTDADRSFAILVPQMALKNRGLMSAILALSARHLSLDTVSTSPDGNTSQANSTAALRYYHETLRYLQVEMKSPVFLRSDELLATVMTISTYEMIDGSGGGWERHLKGVFWIQRSQTIHGESEGLKKRIWWAWLRQDIWVAFKERRKILSFYRLIRACSDLEFWELVDRSVWLLGQCVNYASSLEENAGRLDLQSRLSASESLWDRLTEWSRCFTQYDRRLPTVKAEDSAFEPIWINPPVAAMAVQIHHFAKLLLFEYTPAVGGMKEAFGRLSGVQASVDTICGIACCIYSDGASLVSTMCLFAAGKHLQDGIKRLQLVELLQAHRCRTGWPHYSLAEELMSTWAAGDGNR